MTLDYRWMNPWKSETIDVSNINVYPGECLTIWLNHNNRSGERDAIQMELRVDGEGQIQIFGDTKKLLLTDWEKWTNEPSKQAPALSPQPEAKEEA